MIVSNEILARYAFYPVSYHSTLGKEMKMITVSCLVCKGLGQIRTSTGTFFDIHHIVRCDYCKGNGKQEFHSNKVMLIKGVPYIAPKQWQDNMEVLNQ